jgi:hypothetical protein
MGKIEVFICVASQDISHARELRRILTDCYGFDVFLYDHSIAPSDDFFKEILQHLKACEIFVPLISDSIKKSSFCNQEIGFVVNRGSVTKIFPISIDAREPYDLIDHVYRLKCNLADKFGILKAATEFFHIVMCHNNFKHLQDRAANGLVEALKASPNPFTTSGIVYMLELTQNEVDLSKQELSDIVLATKNNPQVYGAGQYYMRLCLFLKGKYKISIDEKLN